MKKIIASIAVLGMLAMTPGMAHAAKKSSAGGGRNKAIYANPLGLVFGLLNLGYEQTIGTSNSSFTVEGNYAGYSVGTTTLTMMGAGGSYRFRGANSLAGWFAGPRLSALSVNVETKPVSVLGVSSPSAKASGVLFGIGGEGGYNWIFGSGFYLGLGGGFNYYLGSVNATATSGSTTVTGGGYSFGGFLPSGFLNLGYAF